MVGVRDYDQTAGEATGRGGIQSARDPQHWMGLEPVNIPAGSEISLVFQPNMDMNPNQLIIPDRFVNAVAVTGANIGPINVAAGDGPMPGEAFRADSTVRFLPAVPITQGQPLRIRVRNMTTDAITGFYCGLVGKVRRSQ